MPCDNGKDIYAKHLIANSMKLYTFINSLKKNLEYYILSFFFFSFFFFLKTKTRTNGEKILI